MQPEEVETVLARGRRFAEVCVVGWRAGAGAGEQVCAVVVPDGPMTEEEAAEEVHRLSAPLSGYKRPTIVRIHDGEPKTVKRSLRRAQVVRWLEQR